MEHVGPWVNFLNALEFTLYIIFEGTERKEW